MADDLSRFLTSTGGRRASITPERLELMGKEAATLLVEKGVPLNESISKLAGAEADINAEQVKRVVEFANTAAYLSFHDKNKMAGEESSYPQFELADPNRILGNLSSGSRPTQLTKVDLDYGRAPEKKKISSPKLEAALEELFLGPAGTEKRASLDFTPETVTGHIMETKDNLVSLKANLEHSGERLDMLRKQADAEYYDAVKRHLLEGGSFTDVVRGAAEVFEDFDLMKEAMVPFVARLFKEKVAKPEDLYTQLQSLEKVAHRPVYEDHPFVAGLGALVALDEEITKVATALTDVDASLARVRKAIREEFLAHP